MVAVFLDYANINASSNELYCKVDYGELLKYLADDSEQRFLQVAYAYVPIDPRQEHAMDEIIAKLWKQGYIVKSKVGSIAGETYKCDFDVEMTLDMVRVSFDLHPDIVVIVSGDSDFLPVVLDMRNRGIRVEIASFDSSMSRQLTHKCSGYINLDTLIKLPTQDEDDMLDYLPMGQSSSEINLEHSTVTDNFIKIEKIEKEDV